MNSQHIEYAEGDTLLEGYCAYPDDLNSKRPAVLIVHDWSGRNDFARKKADALASLGYIGFAVDMYGNGKLGETKDEKIALMQPLMDNRLLLASRMRAALQTVQTLDDVDIHRIGVIGFCFGGLCALDLARTGADIAAAVSFHGLLGAPSPDYTNPVKARILVLHGYADPMVTPDQVLQFADEMNRKKANWEIDMYGNTLHAFTNPQANDPDFGTVYNKQADARSWIAMREFFKEVFSE